MLKVQSENLVVGNRSSAAGGRACGAKFTIMKNGVNGNTSCNG